MNQLRVMLANSERVLGPDQEAIVGRDPDVDIVVADSSVSRRHARIRADLEGWLIEDLGSTHGMYVGEDRVMTARITGQLTVRLGPADRGEQISFELVQHEAPATVVERSRVPADDVTLRADQGRPLHLVMDLPGGAPLRVDVPAGGAVVVGRGAECDLVVPDVGISKRHCRVEVQSDGRAYVEDLGSRNGTMLDGSVVRGRAELRDGSTLRLGAASIVASWDALPRAAAPRAGEIDGPIAQPIGPGSPASSMARLKEQLSVMRRAQSPRRTLLLAGGATAAVLVVGAAIALIWWPREPAVSEIIEVVGPSTVSVQFADGDGWTVNGTGWVYNGESGLVVTNHHVIDGLDELAIGVNGETVAATVIGTSECDDLALLRVSGVDDLRELELGNQDDVRQGDRVVALGFPVSAGLDDLTATSGVVAVVRKSIFDDQQPDQLYTDVIQTDADINPGNSGGPLVNSRMQLIGVNTWALTGEALMGQSYAIGVDHVRRIIPQLESGSLECGD